MDRSEEVGCVKKLGLAFMDKGQRVVSSRFTCMLWFSLLFWAPGTAFLGGLTNVFNSAFRIAPDF